MKKLISLLLALTLTICAAAVSTVSATAAEGFQEGDVLYLRLENPPTWADNATLYVNFTEASRTDNGGVSVVIADADKSLYNPSTGVVYDSARSLYKYTVTAADAGKTAMRFWRGNAEKLWNCSVALSADDYKAGKNTAVVTDWNESGSLESSYDYDLDAALTLSDKTPDEGETVRIALELKTAIPDAVIAYSISVNGTKIADTAAASFTPASAGAYAVSATVTATDHNGRTLGIKTLSDSFSVGGAAITALQANTLYAHASSVSGADSEAWVRLNDGETAYFFLPSSAKASETVEIFNAYSRSVTIDSTTLSPGALTAFKAEAGKTYRLTINNNSRNLKFMFSSAEAALFVNNENDFDGADFFTYLQANKSHEVPASGALTTPDGAVDVQEIKKIKGRGNTSWNADKKGFNVNFKSAIELAGMEKCKKFSLVSNFQDAAMARNRVLFDLADEIGMPYASDSRFVDFYTNGVYQGTYQMCQKVDVGKNNLVSDFEEDDYLDTETGGVKADFCFVCEIDASPSDDDFHFTLRNGNNLTMKAPQLSADDPNYNAVRNYIGGKFTVMYNKMIENAADLNDYIDVHSLAQMYLINEFGKNWDTGVSSLFFTYKPDENGNYKFFASPVWDYDNTLGNARGVERDLNSMRVTDYTLPSGWFATKKSGAGGNNFLAQAAKSSVVMSEVYTSWFEEFVPALGILDQTGVDSGELYSGDVYRGILADSAAMNYHIWELVTDSNWICDHSSLTQFHADYTYNAQHQITGVSLTQDSRPTSYDQYTFDGQMDYMLDWARSRAAWISAQYITNYTPTPIPTEPTEPETEPATEAPKPDPKPALDTTHTIAGWIFDATDAVEGEKLTAYGSSDGYAATIGTGTMTLSVDGENLRALEWSAAEYGKSGVTIVPLMAAGKNNLWGTPYIRFDLSAKGYRALRFTGYFAASNKAPAEWKLQYATDGETFTDIEGATFTVSAETRKVMTPYFSLTSLPDNAANAETLSIRIVPVSMTTVAGGTTADKPSGGELALNYLLVDALPADAVYELGDVNRNGELDILDATMIQRHLAHIIALDNEQLALADTNHNGEIDILDATMIQRKLARLISEF